MSMTLVQTITSFVPPAKDEQRVAGIPAVTYLAAGEAVVVAGFLHRRKGCYSS